MSNFRTTVEHPMANKHEQSIAGMQRAMMHALDMNDKGRLDDKELSEFRRFIGRQALKEMPMRHHCGSRKTNPCKGTAAKIIADYLSKLWNEGHIADQTYIAEMQQI